MAALSTWVDSSGVSLPLETPTWAVVAATDSNGAPQHEPSMAIGKVRMLATTARDTEIATSRRLFAEEIAPMAYNSLIFADVRHIRKFSISET